MSFLLVLLALVFGLGFGLFAVGHGSSSTGRGSVHATTSVTFTEATNSK